MNHFFRKLMLSFITITTLAFSSAVFAKPVNELYNSDHWMAVVGDSATTGAASDPRLQPNLWSLANLLGAFVSETRHADNHPEHIHFWGFWLGTTPYRPATRVLYSSLEFENAKQAGTVTELNLAAKASLKTDVEEYSFGYSLGQRLGIKPQDIVFVGQNGTRVSSLPIQFARIFEMKTATLPPLVLVSYNANDFCSESVLETPREQLQAEFQTKLQRAWSETTPFLRAHPKGTRIVVLSPIEVANVIANPKILQQKIEFTGAPLTCRELRERTDFESLQREMQKGLQGMCGSVLKTKPDDSERLQKLREIQSDFRAVWRRVINDLNGTLGGTKSISWHFIEQVADIEFTEGDVANDCFHPSKSGSRKIMDVLFENLPQQQ